MPPRRRGKAASARTAAMQAVERRKKQEDHHHHHHHGHHQHHLDQNDDDASPPPLTHDDDAVGGEEEQQQQQQGQQKNNAQQQQQENKSDVVVVDACLHCHQGSSEIQVRCDECEAFICQTCHWCHEFQANHEIRVCDRCDAFYCRRCDEMDQCDDCGEVVCASCSTLLSCKFCGGGLCEECATACGRCGIVLCSRDAKFAVDCDTCRLSYCLVCLASGSKDPCVRCGHRPSKRMEQLVHLRLKSIYKAFKQSSGRSSSSSSSKDCSTSTTVTINGSNTSSSNSHNSKSNHHSSSSHHHASHNNKHHSNNASNATKLLHNHYDAANSHHRHHHDDDCDGDDEDGVGADPQILLQAAATASSSSTLALTYPNGGDGGGKLSSSSRRTLSTTSTGGNTSSMNQAKEMVDRYMAEKEKADAAAEALLLELQEEEEAIKSKKTKRKRKKERQQAKREEERKKEESVLLSLSETKQIAVQEADKAMSSSTSTSATKSQSPSSLQHDEKDSTDSLPSKSTKQSREQSTAIVEGKPKTKSHSGAKKVGSDDIAPQNSAAVSSSSASASTNSKSKDEPKETDMETEPEKEVDPIEAKLMTLIEKEDIKGIEELMCTIRGVPGKAALRKNAKKALKKLRLSCAEKDTSESEKQIIQRGQAATTTTTTATVTEVNSRSRSLPSSSQNTSSTGRIDNNNDSSKVTSVSGNNNSKASGKFVLFTSRQKNNTQLGTSPLKTECVMPIDSSLVGRVIGKGGQKIRDLMEETGARIRIEQLDPNANQDQRMVYVSGSRKNIDHAIRLMKQLVGKTTPPRLSPPQQSHRDDGISGGTSPQKLSHQQQNSGPVLRNGYKAAPGVLHDAEPKQSNDNSNRKPASTERSTPPRISREQPSSTLPTVSAETTPACPPGVTSSDVQEETPVAEHVMTCEPRFVPLLIGRRGWTIKHIQDSSGARVDIDQSVTPRRIKVSGTEANVKVAIGLVRNVLSYPHAQLHQGGGGDMLTAEVLDDGQRPMLSGIEQHNNASVPLDGAPPRAEPVLMTPATPENNDERNHSPPPSSLIMTGDAKSLISASSSLSSTPEPSMASSSKGYCSQLQTGPLIPPEYGVAGAYPLPSPSAPPTGNGFLQQDSVLGDVSGARGSGMIGAAGAQPYGAAAGAGGLMGMHPGQSFGIPPSVPPYPKSSVPLGTTAMMHEQQHPAALGVVVGDPMPSAHLNMGAETNRNLHNQTQSLSYGGMGVSQGNPMQMHQQAPFPPLPQQQQNQQEYKPHHEPVQDNSLHNLIGTDNQHGDAHRSTFDAPASLSTGLWNHCSAADVPSIRREPQNYEGYYLDSLRLENQKGAIDRSGLPLNYDAGQCVGERRTGMKANPLGSIPDVLDAGRDDSRLVDNLFAPGGSGESDQQAMLTGFQQLTVNGGDGLNGGVWGSSLPAWNEGDTQNFISTKELDSSLFAGLKPPMESQEHQHPTQSRFNWGSTGESLQQT